MNNLKRKHSSEPEAPERRVQLRGIDGLGESTGVAAVEVSELRNAAADPLAAIEGEHPHVSEIASRIPTLDDVYLHLTGERMAHAG